MEQVTLWYLTDNDQGVALADEIKAMGLTVEVVNGSSLKSAAIRDDVINIPIIDLINLNPISTLQMIAQDQRIQSCLKFVMINKKEIKEIKSTSFNIIHVEFISRPVVRREFLLLLEKSIVVERYREILKYISKEAESRIETYEGMLDINRKKVFETDKEKTVFEKILTFEKNLLKEQLKLSGAIKDFTLLRQSEIFDMRSRINAEDMLADLRRKELMDAKNVIEAQESVIDYSARELKDATTIISASEKIAELGRMEAMDLHGQLKREREINKTLSEEFEKLLHENESLKSEIAKQKSDRGNRHNGT